MKKRKKKKKEQNQNFHVCFSQVLFRITKLLEVLKIEYQRILHVSVLSRFVAIVKELFSHLKCRRPLPVPYLHKVYYCTL